MRFKFIDVPGSVKLPARSVFCMIAFLLVLSFLAFNYSITKLPNYSISESRDSARRPTENRVPRCLLYDGLKPLSDHFFTFLPERLGGLWIEGICPYPFADGGDGHVVWHDLADVAVLAISGADFVRGGDDACPHGSCGSLRNGLELERRLTLGCELLIPLFDHLFDAAVVHVATQLGPNASRMHRRGAHATIAVPLVEGHGEEDVRRLRSAIGDERLVGRPFEVGIVEVDIGEAVTRRRQVDQPPACVKERRNPIDQD